MQKSVSMHKSPTQLSHSRMNQAWSEEEEKEWKIYRKERGQEADGKKAAPPPKKKKKKLSEELNKEYLHAHCTAQVNNAGRGTPTKYRMLSRFQQYSSHTSFPSVYFSILKYDLAISYTTK